MKTLILALTLALSLPADAHKVIGIADGDTLTLVVDKRPLKIRLANIDAPEKTQAFGERSRQSLSELCFGKDASYATQEIDRYGRTVAVVICAGIEANRRQVERGMAWVYTKYNKDVALPALQEAAHTERRGLWRDRNPLPPWEFRKKKARRLNVASQHRSVGMHITVTCYHRVRLDVRNHSTTLPSPFPTPNVGAAR